MKRIIYIDNFVAHHGYSPTTGYVLVPLLQKNGFDVIAASNKTNQVLRVLHMLFTIVKYRKNAVVLIATYSTSAFYFAYSCSLLSKLLRISYIPCLHGGNLPDRIATSPQLAQQYFGKSAINVAVSGYLQQAVLSKGWRCTIIPNTIQTAEYPFKLRSAPKPKLLWVRSFHKVYNPQIAVYALDSLRKVYPDATLTMVGPDKDGSLRECMNLVKNLHLNDAISFTGKLSKAAWIELSSTHDIFINTTTADNLPVSVIEAMALGMAVISTDAGGIPYLIQDGVNGLLCKVNDTNAMVNKISHVLNNASLATSLSIHAQAASAQFDEMAVMEQWQKLLYSL